MLIKPMSGWRGQERILGSDMMYGLKRANLSGYPLASVGHFMMSSLRAFLCLRNNTGLQDLRSHVSNLLSRVLNHHTSEN